MNTTTKPPDDDDVAAGADRDGGVGPPEPDLDVVLDVLQNERRRAALAVLRDADGGVRKQDLADDVAAHLSDGDADSDFRKTIYVTLHQNHLPKLLEEQVVTKDEDDYLHLGPRSPRVIDTLDRIEQQNAVSDAVGNALSRFAGRFGN